MAKNKQKDTCLACNKAFTKSDASIQCVMCGLWIHHKPCSLVSDDGFKFLSEQLQATGYAYWGCRPCVSYSQAITKKVREVEKKLDEVQKDVKDNAKEIGRVDKNVEDLRKELDKVKSKQREDTGMFITAEEYREREARRANVIMHRVQEPVATTAEERRQADITECGNILQAIGLQQEKKEIKTCRRLGARGEGPRPMVVVMNQEASRTAILAATGKLRSTKYSDISIVPDLTQQQRQEEAGLTAEAERKNREELTEDDQQKNLTWQVVGQRGARKIIKARTRTEQSQRGGRGTRGAMRGRPVVPQPTGRPTQSRADQPTIPGPELLPSRKRPRDYRPAARAGDQAEAGAEGGEMEEDEATEDEEETGSPAHKK
jgi:hypothetical protein